MNRIGFLLSICGAAAVAYSCGGTSTSDLDGGVDAGQDSTTSDSGGSDAGGVDSGGTDSGGVDAGCADDGGCASFGGDCGDGGTCPADSVCVTKTAGLQTSHKCFPLPACGCNGKSACECVGACACGNEQCQGTQGSIDCVGPISRREYKTDITYVGDEERAALAKEALATHMAEYRYKTEPAGAQRHLGFIIDDMPAPSPAVSQDRTHVNLYGYTTMLLATVQQQQKQIDALQKQVDALKKKR